MNQQIVDKWLISGASGLFGTVLCRHLVEIGRPTIGLVHDAAVGIAGVEEVRVDLGAPATADGLIARLTPDVVVHAAGLTNVDACEHDESLAMTLHAGSAEILARQCAERESRFVYISSDHLWDGSKAYVDEDERPTPINAYARSKVEGERRVMAANPAALIIRTNFFGKGRSPRRSLSDWMTDELLAGRGVDAFVDSFFTPVGLDFLASSIVRLIKLDQSGVFHIASQDRISKFEFARKLCARLNLPLSLVRPSRISEANLYAPRPSDMSLGTRKAAAIGLPIPTTDESINSTNL
jgi:dTDP-4-dehydrorhamnose reductase